jgi:hypothetical protein
MFKHFRGYRAMLHTPKYFYILRLGLLLCLLGIVQQGFSSTRSFASAPAGGYTINGIVFDDYNQNGVQDAREPGINGVTVTAYNSANKAVATATSASVNGQLGQYTLNIPDGTGPVRVQFNDFGAGAVQPQLAGMFPSNHASGTPVQFVSGEQASNTVNMGLEYPREFCQNNPQLATSCYVRGDQTAVAPAVVRFPYDSSGTESSNPPTPLALTSDVGATWGLAYRRSSDDLFVAAYTKQLVGYKPHSDAASIYIIHNASTSASSIKRFLDLNMLLHASAAKLNPHTTKDNLVPDLSAYDAVGKTGFGGMALSDDESTLYAMSLADRSLYAIPVGAAPDRPVAPHATSISATPVPIPSDCKASDIRPFAVAAYRGLIYIGEVCSAESTVHASIASQGNADQLKAYIFTYTPDKGFAQQPAFEMPLNYTRHCADQSFEDPQGCVVFHSAQWRPWQPSYKIAYTTINGAQGVYPQPIFTNIAFDNGDLILGLRDRYGDQTGHNVANLPEARTAGDVLRACLKTPGDLASGWQLENNGSCGGTTTIGQGNGKGPGGGQYYYHQYYQPFHDHVSEGGLLQIPGFPGVITTAFDPGTTVFAGGTRTYDDKTGDETNNYEIFNTLDTPVTFGKANGLGDLVALCQSAPIEIGHRVWNDINGNGIQDANEPAIPGVTVHLYASDGKTLLQTTTTDASGTYYFTILPYKHYVIRLDNAADYTTGPLKNFQLTTVNQSAISTGIGSKAVLPAVDQPIGNDNFPQITVDEHTPGQNDFTLDTGFTAAPDLAISKSHQGGDYFQSGSSVTYTLQVHDVTGTVLAGEPVTVTDTIPHGLTHVQAKGSHWHITASKKTGDLLATYTGDYPIVAGTDLPHISVTATVTGNAGEHLHNIATVSTPRDSNPTNNRATDTIIINHPLDIAVSVTPPVGCLTTRQTLTYKLQVRNNRASGVINAAVPVRVLNALPAGVLNPGATGDNWHVTLRQVKGVTLVDAIYSGPRPIGANGTLPTLTISATVGRGSGTSLVNVTLVKVVGGKSSPVRTTLHLCPNKPPAGGPGLPPTGSNPLDR